MKTWFITNNTMYMGITYLAWDGEEEEVGVITYFNHFLKGKVEGVTVEDVKKDMDIGSIMIYLVVADYTK